MLIGISVSFLVACESIQGGPESAYNKYWKACESGDLATAESLVTDDGIARSVDLGACIYTHDAWIKFGQSLGAGVNSDFISDKPELELSGNTAYLRWKDTSGSVNTVIMYKINGDLREVNFAH